MNRRSFLSLLGLGAVAAAAPIVLVEPEPVRRYWQVPRNAPVGHRILTPDEFVVPYAGPKLESYTTLSYDVKPSGDWVLVSIDQVSAFEARDYHHVVRTLREAVKVVGHNGTIVVAPGVHEL